MALNHGKLGAVRHHARVRRQPHAWLGAGAIVLGLGAALASGSGSAHADDNSSAAGASSSARPTSGAADKGGVTEPSARAINVKKSAMMSRTGPTGPSTSPSLDTTGISTDNVYNTNSSAAPSARTKNRAASVRASGGGATTSKRFALSVVAHTPARGAPVSPTSTSSVGAVETWSQVGLNQPGTAATRRVTPSLTTTSARMASTTGFAERRAVSAEARVALMSTRSAAPLARIADFVAGLLLSLGGMNSSNPVPTNPIQQFLYSLAKGIKDTFDPAPPAGGPTLYSANYGNTVSVINPATGTVKTLTGFNNPTGVAIMPNGTYVYVTSGVNAPVSVIDTTTGTVVATITAGAGSQSAAVSPDGSTLYVTNSCKSSTNCLNGTVSVIDTATNTVTNTITVGQQPRTVAVSPDGNNLYVVEGLRVGAVSVISTATKTVTDSITVGSQPSALAVSPDGHTVYVTNAAIDNGSANGNTVSVIDTATNTVTNTITVGYQPLAVAVSRDGSTVYVTNSCATSTGCSVLGNTVSVIDTATNTVTNTITVGSYPDGVAIDPVTGAVYIANYYSSTVSVIDPTTDTVIKTITLHKGAYPASLALKAA